MFLSLFERKIIFRYLVSHKKEGFISFFALFSFLGIALGVAVLIIVTSVMNGFRENLLEAVVGMKPHVVALTKNENFIINSDHIDQMQKDDNVLGVYPTLEKQNILSFRSQAQGVFVQGISKESFIRRKKIYEKIEQGDIKNFNDYSIIIGKKLATDFNISVGDQLLLMTPEGNATAFGTIPRQRSFKVVGIFNYGMHEYDKNYVFIPLETAQSFYKLDNQIHYLGIFIRKIVDAPLLAKSLNRKFYDNYHFIDWKHQDHSILHAVEIEKNVMFLILTLIIIIAGFNITSSLIMLVKDKTKAIGILKTMGADHSRIGKIFLSIGMFIGIAGTSIGLALGVIIVKNLECIRRFLEALLDVELFSAEIYYLTKLPAVLLVHDIFSIIALALSLSFCASFFPARKAIKMNIVDSLNG